MGAKMTCSWSKEMLVFSGGFYLSYALKKKEVKDGPTTGETKP
jgi:hypothetical protein